MKTSRALYQWALPLRLFCVRVLNYVVARVPSLALRRLWYQHVLGIRFYRDASVSSGAYVWFNGIRDTRRAGIQIGRNSRINRRCTLDVRSGLTIGENVRICPEVMILGGAHDHNDPTFRTVDAGPVTIEDHVSIGPRALILPGVTIGRGAVVVARSVVTKSVPPMTVVAGIPAKPVADRGSNVLAFGVDRPLPPCD